MRNKLTEECTRALSKFIFTLASTTDDRPTTTDQFCKNKIPDLRSSLGLVWFIASTGG